MSESVSMAGVVKELSLSLTDFKYDLEKCFSNLIGEAAAAATATDDTLMSAVDMMVGNPLRTDSERKSAILKSQMVDISSATDSNLTKSLFDKELLLHETAVLRNKLASLTRQLNVADDTAARLRGDCATALRANEALLSERARMEAKDSLYHKKMTLLLNEFEFLKISVATFDDVIVSTQAQVQALRTQGEKDNAQLSLVQRDARKASAKIADDQQRVLALQATNKALRRSVAERQADADVLALRLSEKADTLGSGDGSAALISEASVNLALRAQLAALEKQGIASALSLEIVSVQLMQANKTAALVANREAEADSLRQQVLALGGTPEQPQPPRLAPPAKAYEFNEELVGKALRCAGPCQREFHFLCEFRNSTAIFANAIFLCPACKPLPPLEASL